MSVDGANYLDIVRLHAEYAAAVDAGRWDAWMDLFEDDCEYRIQPRENHERGLPLATLMLLSKDMLRDRVFGVKETLFHDPYVQRHVVGAPLVRAMAEGVVETEANYAVFRTRLDGVSTVFNVGRYLDRIRLGPAGPRFVSRLCIYDTETVPNSIIHPI